jgi:hypothetical protein
VVDPGKDGGSSGVQTEALLVEPAAGMRNIASNDELVRQGSYMARTRMTLLQV